MSSIAPAKSSIDEMESQFEQFARELEAETAVRDEIRTAVQGVFQVCRHLEFALLKLQNLCQDDQGMCIHLPANRHFVLLLPLCFIG